MFDNSINKTSLCFKQYQITSDDELFSYFKNIFHVINEEDYSKDYLLNLAMLVIIITS